MASHLVIPDAHAMPTVGNRRFKWLSRLIVDKKPDVIICIGDLFDMDSLCSYNVGKDAEGKRYFQDLRCGWEALALIDSEIDAYNVRRRVLKMAQYKPRKVFCVGNHEYRIVKEFTMNPRYAGTFCIENLHVHKYGWEMAAFLQPIVIDGISYSHYFVNPKSGKQIGGAYNAANVIKKLMTSITFGHSHHWNLWIEHLPDGRKLHGLESGVYLDPNQWLDYAGAGNNAYWNGVTMCHNVHDGRYDVEQISVKRIRDTYSVPEDDKIIPYLESKEAEKPLELA